MSYRYAILGLQHPHGAIMLSEMQALGHTCVGIYDPEPDVLAKAMAERYGAPLADNPETLLREADIIGCAGVSSERIETVELCARHGRPVMLDKPAVVSKEGLARLESVISSGRIEVGMLLTERFRPELVTLKRLLEQGCLGDIVHIGTRKPHRLRPERRPAWHFDKARSGGIVNDLLIHDFDLVRWLTACEPIAFTGFAGKRMLPEYPTFCDWASVEVLLDNRTSASLYADWHTPDASWTWGDCRLFVNGTKGSAELRLEGDPLLETPPGLLLVTHREPLRSMELDRPREGIMADFLRRVQGRQDVRIAHKDILAASRAALDADAAVQWLV